MRLCIVFKNMNKKELIKDICIFAVTFVLLLTFLHFVRFPTVDGDSMSPTYENDDRIVTFYTKSVGVNDIVIIWCEPLDEYVVKRVIGVPGDHIEIKDGHVYRNGVRLYESYVKEQDWFDADDVVDVIVPSGEIFILGDNRSTSADSRLFGTLPQDDVFGRILFRLDF